LAGRGVGPPAADQLTVPPQQRRRRQQEHVHRSRGSSFANPARRIRSVGV
jgi:hypothetical protein